MSLIALRQRPRPDQAHLSPHDIDELRPLVNKRAPQNVSQTGHPRIAFEFEKTFRLPAPPLQTGVQPFGPPGHGPELEHGERNTSTPVARLPEDHWSPIARPDQQRRQQHHRRTDNRQTQSQRAFSHAASLRLHVQPEFKHALAIRPAPAFPHQHRRARGRHRRIIPRLNGQRQEIKDIPRLAIPVNCEDYAHV